MTAPCFFAINCRSCFLFVCLCAHITLLSSPACCLCHLSCFLCLMVPLSLLLHLFGIPSLPPSNAPSLSPNKPSIFHTFAYALTHSHSHIRLHHCVHLLNYLHLLVASEHAAQIYCYFDVYICKGIFVQGPRISAGPDYDIRPSCTGAFLARSCLVRGRRIVGKWSVVGCFSLW